MVEYQQQHGSRLLLLDFLLVFLSLTSYLTDVTIGTISVYKSVRNADYVMAAIFAGFLFSSGVITSIVSCLWLERNSSTLDIKLPTAFRIFRVLTIVFLVSPVSGYDSPYLFLLFKSMKCWLLFGPLQIHQRPVLFTEALPGAKKRGTGSRTENLGIDGFVRDASRCSSTLSELCPFRTSAHFSAVYRSSRAETQSPNRLRLIFFV